MRRPPPQARRSLSGAFLNHQQSWVEPIGVFVAGCIEPLAICVSLMNERTRDNNDSHQWAATLEFNSITFFHVYSPIYGCTLAACTCMASIEFPPQSRPHAQLS